MTKMMMAHHEWGEEEEHGKTRSSVTDRHLAQTTLSLPVLHAESAESTQPPDRKVPLWPRQKVRKGPLINHCLEHNANM